MTRPGGERLRRLEWLALPLLVFALAQAALAVAALLCARDPLDPTSFSRRDSTKYIKIARFGYFEDPADPKAGDAGWFPGYPLAMRAAAALSGARAVSVGRALAALFHVALLAALARLLAPLEPTRRALALLLAGFFPGFVYYAAVFPVSMLAFLSVVTITLAARGRLLAAGLAGAVGAFTYPTGFLLALPLAAGGLLHRADGRRSPAAAGIAAILPGLGLGAVLVYHHFALGHWDAFFAFQRAFGHSPSNPAATLLAHLGRLGDPHPPSRLIGLQTLVTLVLLTLATAAWWRNRRTMGRLETMLIVNAVAFWLFPLFLGPTVNPYRQEALLVGITPLLGRLPVLALLCLLVLLVALGGGMAVLFFDDVLV